MKVRSTQSFSFMRFEIPNVLNGTVIETTFYHDKDHETQKRETLQKLFIKPSQRLLLLPGSFRMGMRIG